MKDPKKISPAGMAAVRPKPIEHPRWKEPGSYGVLHNHYFNHYLKHDSAPTQITDQSSPAERDAAQAIRALPKETVLRIRRAIENNFQEKLTERGIAYKNTIIHAIKENCEPDCARRARQKAIDAFGRDRVENAHRLSRKGQTVLKDFIDDKKRAFIVASKIRGAVKWNTYMTEGIRVAEQILMELLVEYEGYRRQEVVQKVRQMREAAENERVEEVMDEIKDKAADAAKHLFGFIKACQEMDNFYYVYTQHPSKREDYPDKDGTFWCRLSDDKWSETKRTWFEGIDDAMKPDWWEHQWYTAEELEGWCETYKTYAETHDPRWDTLRSTFGGKPAHQNWIDLSQDVDDMFKFDEWQGYTVAGLKFFLVDLLDHYRRTARGVCEEGAEEAQRVEVIKQNVENQRVERAEARAELDKKQKIYDFIVKVNETSQQVDNLHESIIQLSRQSEQWTEKFKKWTELLDQFVKAWNEFTKFKEDDLFEDVDQQIQKEFEDDVNQFEGEIARFKVFTPFVKAGHWLERTIELWQKNSENEWGQIKYTLETEHNKGEYEMQLVTDDMIGEEKLENISLKSPASLQNIIAKREHQHNIAVAKQERKRRTETSRKAAEQRQRKQQRKRREEAEKKKQDENRARAAQIERRAAAIEKQRQELAQRSVEMQRQHEQERLQEESELARQANLLNRVEEQNAQNSTAKEALRKISEMKPSKISVEEAIALPHLVKSLDEKLPLESVDDDTVKYISKCRKVVREVKNITIKESATNVLRKVKESLEKSWLLTLEVEYFESKLVKLNEPEKPRRRKSRRKPKKEEEKAPWQKSKETKMWEKDIWPLIQEDMMTSFHITDWNKTVKANKERESEAELKTSFLKNQKEAYAEDDEGTWWVLKNKGTVIATTQVDTSQTLPYGPELYVLKVHEDYESLGVGRYFSFLIQQALFNEDRTKLDAQMALRDTMKDIDWDKTEGIVLTPSTVNEKGVYENWKNTRAAYEDKVEKAVLMENANVREPKHDGEVSPAASDVKLEEEELFAAPVARAPVLFKPGHPVHAMHATFAKAVRAHFSAMSKMFSKNAVPRRRYRLGPIKVYPMQSKSLMVPTPTAIKLRTKTAPPVAMPSLMSASKGAPPSPPRGMFRG